MNFQKSLRAKVRQIRKEVSVNLTHVKSRQNPTNVGVTSSDLGTLTHTPALHWRVVFFFVFFAPV